MAVGFREFEDAIHQLPLLVGGRAGLRSLEPTDEVLPLRLAVQRSEAGESTVPIEVVGCLDNHEKEGTETVYLHIKDTHLADAGGDFRPDMLRGVPVAVLLYKLCIVLER